MDNYLFIKKELGTTKIDLLQYTYGLDSTMDGVGITNERGQFEYVNPSHAKLYGYSREEFLQSGWSLCYSRETIESLVSIASPALSRDGYWRGEVEGVRKDGTTFPQEIALSQIKGSHKVFCVVRDITEQKQAEAKIEQLALSNELTHLPNRRSLVKQLDIWMQSAASFYILFLDLDRFKNVNDTLGHDVGDQLLIQVSERLTQYKSENASIFHMGGDEFILLVEAHKAKAVEDTASLVEEIGRPFYVSGSEINITASIGVSCYPDDHDEPEELIRLADTAMYYVKLSGKDGYAFINDEMKAALQRKSYLEIELKKVVRNEQLTLRYQPILDLKSNNIVGVEALLRWTHPKLGVISPAEFIPIAEETGVIIDIGRWVLKEAIRQASKWEKEGLALNMSVNVSQRQLSHDGALVDIIRNTLKEFEFNSGRLKLEITESVMEHAQTIIPILSELKRLGVHIALDDFGTGFSSLALLKRLPIDSLKIDQSFIRELPNNPVDIAIVKSIVELSINLKLDIVAEGIETSEQLQCLKELNCTHGQGYFFSKPIPAAELEKK